MRARNAHVRQRTARRGRTMKPRMSLTNRILYALAKIALTVMGWRAEGDLPAAPKYVMIGAHHTSYWDLPIFLMAAAVASHGFATMKLAWIGKHTAFHGVLGVLFRKLGGIAVNRSAGHHVVKPILRAFQHSDQLALGLAPTGTIKKVEHWKPGFYYIARLAHVPIVCGFIDYQRKVVGLGPIIDPTGDLEADMQIISEFYGHVCAKYPERVGAVSVRTREAAPITAR